MNRTTRSLFYILILLVSVTQNVYSETSPEPTSDSLGRQLLSEIKEKLYQGETDSLYSKILQLENLAQADSLLDFEGSASKLIGQYFRKIENFDSALYYFNKALLVSKKSGDTLELGILEVNIAVVEKMHEHYESALIHYQKGSDLLEAIGDSVWYGVANDHMGFIYFKKGNYIFALQHMQKALAVFLRMGNKANIGSEYNTMGLVYRKMKEKEEEEQAYLHAIQNLKTVAPPATLGMAFNNLSEVYIDKGEIDKGPKTLEQAKDIYEEINYPLGLCAYYAVLSYYHLQTSPPDYQLVKNYSKKSMDIALQYNDDRQFADATSFFGQACIHLNELDEARRALDQGLLAAEKNGFKHEEAKILEVISEAYEKSQMPGNALVYLKRFIRLNDSLIGEDKIEEFSTLDVRFRFKQKQLIDSLDFIRCEAQMKFVHEKEIRDQKQFQIILGFVLLMVLIIAVFIFVNSRKTKIQLKQLSDKNNLINQHRLEIEDFAKQVQEAYARLHELDEFKQAMTNMLVHDLKNPLNLLINLDAFHDEKDKSLIIDRTTRQMLNLVMNMLDINQSENGKMHINKHRIRISDVFQEAHEEIEYLYLKQGVHIINKAKQDFNVNADKDILIRVFVNLFTNAIKFSPHDSEITWNTKIIADGRLKISVTDHGPGIAKENQQIIFEKFKQIDPIHSGQIKSSGLGLAFCKQAVGSHHWSIGVDSEPGKGSEFWIVVADSDFLNDSNE